MGRSNKISGPRGIHALVIKLSESDPLYGEKKKLLESKGFSAEVQITLEDSSSAEWTSTTLKTMQQIFRIIHLDEAELYFFEDPPLGCYSLKNEMEVLNSMISHIDSLITITKCLQGHALRCLRDATVNLLKEFWDRNTVNDTIWNVKQCNEENHLLQWGERIGVNSRVQIARMDYFKLFSSQDLNLQCYLYRNGTNIEGFGRGAIAQEDLEVGDIALEIPVPVIISEDAMKGSDMYPVLQRIDGISVETMLLLWSMKERYNSSSKYKIYFDMLPREFNTGLSFGIDAIMVLDGTILLEEIIQAKEHLRTQYEELFPTLCDAHPDVFPPELFTWEHYLWACELWYSNSMKIQFADGELRICLIPIAGFLNHSLYPHISRYGKVDPVTNSLKFPMSRPCRVGEQCFLSYGNFSSSHLIIFYGFLPHGDNPYDVIPLDIDNGFDGDNNVMDSCKHTTHMLRGTWFSNNCNIFSYGLPSPLLDYLRNARNMSDTESPMQDKLEVEAQVLEDLYATFSSMMEGLSDTNPDTRENIEWDVKLALQYKDLQRRIMSSILRSCSSGLKMLEDEHERSHSRDHREK